VVKHRKHRHKSLKLSTGRNSLVRISSADNETSDWLVVGIKESGAKIRRSTAVHHGATDDIRAFLERDALRDAVINHGLPVAVNTDDFLAVHPPNGGGIGTDGQPDARHFFGTVDHRNIDVGPATEADLSDELFETSGNPF